MLDIHFAWLGVFVIATCLFLYIIYREVKDLKKLLELQNANDGY